MSGKRKNTYKQRTDTRNVPIRNIVSYIISGIFISMLCINFREWVPACAVGLWAAGMSLYLLGTKRELTKTIELTAHQYKYYKIFMAFGLFVSTCALLLCIVDFALATT